MDKDEKTQRCWNAPTTQRGKILSCIVYGRRVRGCYDCAFGSEYTRGYSYE